MVGAICGLEDFLSNVNIFCLQALFPGHCSINVLQLTLKPESSHSRPWSQDAAVEVMYSPPVKAGRVEQLPSPLQERSWILSGLFHYLSRRLAELLHTCTTGLPLSGMLRLTVCDTNQSLLQAHSLLHLHHPDCDQSLDPPSKEGQFSCSSAAVGNRWEGSWMGRMLHRQSADSQQPLALSFLHFLRSAWSSMQSGEPFGW